MQELVRFPLIRILDRVLLRHSVPGLPLAKAARRGISKGKWERVGGGRSGSFRSACRWRPGKGILQLRSTSSRSRRHGVQAQQPGVLHNSLGCSVRVRRTGVVPVANSRAGAGAGEWHAAPTPTRQAPPPPPRAAGPCPPHPAAGGQCCYEEKAPIVPTTNCHTPDLRYCAPPIEMQTSRVRRPQSACPPPPAPCSALPRAVWWAPSSQG